MKKRYLTTAAALSTLLFSCGTDNLTGNVEGTDTGTLVTPAGTPVSNASVRVYTYKDSTGVWEDSLTTDENGTYSLSGLDAGRYSVWAETDSSVLFLESVSIDEDSKFADTDTMQAYKSVSVPVKIQPNHNPQTVEVQIWGTPIRHNVTEEGLLVLNKIPAGQYFTRLTSTLDGYSPTNDTLTIEPDSPEILNDTLKMIYTGIPVVNGIEASYDTLNGVATISWDNMAYGDLDGYVIYRDPAGAIDLSTDPVGFTSETTFEDHVNTETTEQLVYRVAIRANSNNEVGPVFYKDTIDYINSDKFLNLVEQDTVPAYSNRELSLKYNISPWVGDVESVTWNIVSEGFSGSGENGNITLTLPATRLYEYLLLEVTLKGSKNRELKDTVQLYVEPKLEKIPGSQGVYGVHTAVVSLKNSVYMKDYYPGPGHQIWKSTNGMYWEVCEVPDSITYGVSNLAVWGEHIWLVNGNGGLFKSTDGISWKKEADLNPADTTSYYYSIVSNNDKLYILKERYNSEGEISLIEYDTNWDIIPLSFEGETAQNTVKLDDHSYNLYTTNGSIYVSGVFENVYKISSNSIEYIPMDWSYEGSFGIHYGNCTILSTGPNNNGYYGLNFIPNSSYPEQITKSTKVISMHLDFARYIEDLSPYIYNGKLMIMTSNGVYTDSPIE